MTPLSATLVALSVSQICTHQIRSLRDELWKTTGDPSFLTLFPLIPLMWIQIGGRLPRALRFPALQPAIAARLDSYVYEGSLFLPIEDSGQLQAMQEIIYNWHRLLAMPPSGTPPPPFPVKTAGMYLGTDSPAAQRLVLQSSREKASQSIPINDFRLVTIDIQSTNDWKHNLRYQVWQDRHLSLDGQDHL